MKKLTRCLVCGNKKLIKFFDLNQQPLANNYVKNQYWYPLGLNYCENCTHTQLTYAIDPKVMFEDYAFVSGTTDTLNKWFKDFADQFKNDSPGRILDIAGNDGTLLKYFKGWDRLNIDPAKNLNHFNEDEGIMIINDFWREEIGNKFGKFDLITAFHVVPHTPTPLSFVKGLRKAIKDTGRIYIETSQIDMLQNGQFDTIYHEHYSQFSEKSMRLLLEKGGFKGWEINITKVPIYGNSMMVEIKRPYYDFNNRANKLKEFLNNIPEDAIGFGAAARATVMINSVNMKLRYVIDENPLKIGKVIPGTDIPIVSPSVLKHEGKLNIVIFAWTFADEIKKKIKKLRPGAKDTFYVPNI
jgi:hypothetical protein